MARRRADGYVMISIIAERYNIHPQTLRLYEREGLIKPARTSGNTRLYGIDEVRKLEMILTLTRERLGALEGQWRLGLPQGWVARRDLGLA